MSTLIPTAHADRDGLAVIGRTLHDLRDIRFEEGTNGAAPAAPATPAAPAGHAAPAQTPDGQTGDGAAPWTKETFDPERAWRLVENLRKDLATAGTDKTELTNRLAAAEGKFDTFTKGLGGLLGFEQPETDPEKLQAKVTDLSGQIATKDTALTAAQAESKAAALSLQVALLAPDLGGNVKALLANTEFKTSIASAEPTDEAAIKAAITQALQANAALKQPPARTGDVNHSGPTLQNLEVQLAAAIEKKDITESIRLKQLIAAAKRA